MPQATHDGVDWPRAWTALRRQPKCRTVVVVENGGMSIETTPLPPFVDMAWLGEHLESVVLVDSRWYIDGSSASDAYARGHLPGAVYLDFDQWLSGAPAGSGLHPLPDPETFASGMGSVGIGNTTTVIAYDDAGGVIAARLVWMLRAIGTAAALLDGGMQAWKGPLETAPYSRPATTFFSRPWPTNELVPLAELDSARQLVDARNADRFDGSVQAPTDPRPGHIPGAVSVPCRANLTAEGHVMHQDELRKTFQAVGISDAATVVSYCGSGVTACHNLLTMEWAGLGRGRLYVGGWSEYGAHVELPAEPTVAASDPHRAGS